jgi:hypothetical protein
MQEEELPQQEEILDPKIAAHLERIQSILEIGKFVEAADAVIYLSFIWKMQLGSYTVDALKMHRRRHNYKPSYTFGRFTLWSKEDLDRLPKPLARTDPRPKRKKKSTDDDDQSNSLSVMLLGSSVSRHDDRETVGV